MNDHKHPHNFALFMLLLSLLFIPVGSFGLAQVNQPEVAGAQDVLSIKTTRTIQTSESSESTRAAEVVEEVTEEATEATALTPDLVVPFYR